MVTQNPTDHAGRTDERPFSERLQHFVNGTFVRSLPFWGIPFLLMGSAVYAGIGWNVLISLTDYEGLASASYSHLDFEMYARAFGSSTFWTAAQNTFVLLVAFTVICLVLGLALAVLLDRNIRYSESIQTIYVLPMALSFVITAQLWLWMYNPDSGLVNLAIKTLGLSSIDFLGNPKFALAAVIFALVWQFSGYAMVVYLAGLRSIPTSQFEAGKIDGASTARIYLRVIIPQLRASSVSAAVVLMVFALKAFTFLYSLTGVFRPPNGTDILATLMVRRAFKYTEWAYGAAIATMLLLLALGVIAPYLYYQHKHGSL
ncbi:glucose/mannose transport system permease protein [Halarchaeum solikamskense]|uniref:carbohydrate ABC transporter permease n=1 Tax=Halarchaeum nitratireducens TaxID=489913 RepID=UPI001B3ABB92|nr:sugar ABC transporter permease [Halarchaeum solikamskense]MBP2252365.1 glucose/mannose transport system permease protein [Halarchaeum solikamskense]